MERLGSPPSPSEPFYANRLLKNAHLRRSPHPSSLQRTFRYASLLRISGALRLGIFDQPEKNEFSNRLSTSEHSLPTRLNFPVSLRETPPLSSGIITGFSAKGKEKILEVSNPSVIWGGDLVGVLEKIYSGNLSAQSI